MKMNKFLAIALAVAVGFSSCAKENGGVDAKSKDNKSLSITIAQPDGTRSIDTPLGDDSQSQDLVTFSNGDLFLCNSSGLILYKFAFSSTASATDQAAGVIKIADATSTNGVTLVDIKGTVSQAFIVANTTSITNANYATAAAVDKYISGVKAIVLSPAEQYSATNKNLAAVTMFGFGDVVDDSSPDGSIVTENNKKKVEIVLRPHVARLEVADLTAVTDADTGVSVEEYNMTGIYVNYYYPSISMDWLTLGTVVGNRQGDSDIYSSVANGGVYANALAGILYDESATFFGNSAATALVKYPNGTDNTKAWAYNLLAAAKFGAGSYAAATTVAPHIIVKMQDIVVDNGEDYSGVKFLTVNKLLDQSDVQITHFEAGKIYQIEPGDFQFTIKNIHDDAELENIDLRMKVSVIKWTTESMKPVLQ